MLFRTISIKVINSSVAVSPSSRKHSDRALSFSGGFKRKRQGVDLEGRFGERRRLMAPKTTGWNLLNLSIGVKKRLEEVSNDNNSVSDIIGFGEFQKIFERILSDMKDQQNWNDLSLDMLIGGSGFIR